jgi:hypothetical protein
MVTDVNERGLGWEFKDGRAERIETATKIWAAVGPSCRDRGTRAKARV